MFEINATANCGSVRTSARDSGVAEYQGVPINVAIYMSLLYSPVAKFATLWTHVLKVRKLFILHFEATI